MADSAVKWSRIDCSTATGALSSYVMKVFSIFKSALVASALWPPLASEVCAETVLVSHAEVEITLEEAFHYSLKHTNPQAYEASIAKPQATRRIIENIYVLKRVASFVEDVHLVSAGALEYLREDLYRRVALERFLDDSIAARMSEIDWVGMARAEYAERKVELKSPEEVRVEHILVSIDGETFEVFVTKVREVIAALARSETFADLIVKYSDDPSVARNGGDLGFLPRERMQPTFSDAAFGLTIPGEIAGPVMTSSGAHFIRLIDRREEASLPFEKVKAELITKIKTETQTRLREELLNEFRAEIEPVLATINEPALVTQLLQKYESLTDTDRRF